MTLGTSAAQVGHIGWPLVCGPPWGWQCPVFLTWVLVTRCIQFMKIYSAFGLPVHSQHVRRAVCVRYFSKKLYKTEASRLSF